MKSRWGFCDTELEDVKALKMILFLELIPAACYIVGNELYEEGADGQLV